MLRNGNNEKKHDGGLTFVPTCTMSIVFFDEGLYDNNINYHTAEPREKDTL